MGMEFVSKSRSAFWIFVFLSIFTSGLGSD